MAIASVRILRAMGELHLLGTLEQSKQLICLWAGYGHPNSSSFAAGLRLLRTQGMIRPGTSKGHLMLTERGERALPTDMVPPTSTEDVHSRLLTILRPKVTKSAKLEQLWDILKDGEPHLIADLFPALGYSHGNSSPFAALIRKLKDYGIASRSNGKVQLTNIAFPLGRP